VTNVVSAGTPVQKIAKQQALLTFRSRKNLEQFHETQQPIKNNKNNNAKTESNIRTGINPLDLGTNRRFYLRGGDYRPPFEVML